MTGPLDDASGDAADDPAADDPEPTDAEPTDAEVEGLRRTALVSGCIGAGALGAACVLYLAAGPPYGVNIGAGALYLLGLLAGVIAGVVLWMAWSTPVALRSPRRPGGLAVSATALVLTCASAVASLGRAGSPGLRVALIGAAALVLAGAVLTLARERGLRAS